MNEKFFRQCDITVMDTIADPDITFDEKGISNYYYEFKKAQKQYLFNGEEGIQHLHKLIDTIKKYGANKPYDCIMGLSGGVDSTYVAYIAKDFGLRPLAVHFDNGWNSELAVMNIENIVNKCGFDLHTLVVDWEEFKDIQLSYIKASVVDIEVPTDHAIGATLSRLALKHGIKYLLSGSNVNTEYIMPKSWIFNKGDHVNLKAIHKEYGTKKIQTFPLNESVLKRRTGWAGIQQLNILNYVDYNKHKAKQTITQQLGWRDYGGKHYESLFTKFYQAYILPEKFQIDKRKAHLSTLILSGELTKPEALAELDQPLYSKEDFNLEKEFFLKKLGLTDVDWLQILNTPRKSHYNFDIEAPIEKRYKWIKPFKMAYRFLYPVK